MGRTIAIILLVIVGAMLLVAVLSTIFSIFGFILSLVPLLLKLAVLGLLAFFVWQIYQKVAGKRTV